LLILREHPEGSLIVQMDALAFSRKLRELHVFDCEPCSRFQRAQLALDRALAEHYVAPALSAIFRVGLKKQKTDRRRTFCDSIWDFRPDLLPIGGGAMMTAGCAWLLPFPPVFR
jgi:hypothetical protein